MHTTHNNANRHAGWWWIILLNAFKFAEVLVLVSGASYIPSNDGYSPPRRSRTSATSRLNGTTRTSDLHRTVGKHSSYSSTVPQATSDPYMDSRSNRPSVTGRQSARQVLYSGVGEEPLRGAGVGASSYRTPPQSHSLSQHHQQQPPTGSESQRVSLLNTPPTRDITDRVLAAHRDRLADGAAVNGLSSYTNSYSSPNTRRY